MSTKPSHLFFYPNLPYINPSLSSILTEPPYPVPLSRMSSTRMYPSTTCHPSLVFLLLRNLQSCQSLQSLATYLLCFVRYLISYALSPCPACPTTTQEVLLTPGRLKAPIQQLWLRTQCVSRHRARWFSFASLSSTTMSSTGLGMSYVFHVMLTN